MNRLVVLIQSHPLEWSGALLFAHHFFDAVVDSLPVPKPMGSPLYEFFYTFLNKLAGNYRKKD